MRRLAGFMTRSSHRRVKTCAKKRTGRLVAPATGPYISKARHGRQNAGRAENRTGHEP